MRQDGATVIIEDDSKNYDMLELGYVRIGDYVGDARENHQGKRGYYQSSVGGKNPFRQGVLQTVHDTWQGVDANTGGVPRT